MLEDQRPADDEFAEVWRRYDDGDLPAFEGSLYRVGAARRITAQVEAAEDCAEADRLGIASTTPPGGRRPRRA